MEELVGSFFCEWTEALADPDRLKVFSQFSNTTDTLDGTEKVLERQQRRPVHWPKDSTTYDFRGQAWTSLTWQPMARVEQFVDAATGSSLAVKRGDTQLALFKVKGRYYATQQMCPHKRAFVLSDGLIGDDYKTDSLWISCPLHKRNYTLSGPAAGDPAPSSDGKDSAGKCSNDETVNIAVFPVEARDDGNVYVKLPPVEELDGVLGTSKWMVKESETEAVVAKDFEVVDRKYNFKGRKGVLMSSAQSHLEGGLGAPRKAEAILAGGERKEGGGGLDW
jgi:nitrite reductase (NAD(P)H)